MLRNQRIQSLLPGVGVLPSILAMLGMMAEMAGNCEVEWQDMQEDATLSTGPLRRRPKPRCMAGIFGSVLMTVCRRSGLIIVFVGFGFESAWLVTSGSLPHIMPTGTTLSQRFGFASAPL